MAIQTVPESVSGMSQSILENIVYVKLNEKSVLRLYIRFTININMYT